MSEPTILESLVATSPDLRPPTKKTYLSAVRGFVAHAGPNPDGWTPAGADAWRTSLLQRLRKQSVNVHVVALKFASRALAIQRNDPAADFARHLRTGRPKISDRDLDGRRQAVPLDVVHRIITAVDGDRPEDVCDRAILVLLIRTGLRRGGLSGVQFADIRRDNAFLALTVTLKGGDRHRLWLDEEASGALDAWLSRLRALGVDEGPVFWSFRRGHLWRPLTPDGVYHVVRRRAEAVGIHLTPHVFRHTFVSALALEGVPYARIRAVTGQGSDRMIQLYTTDTEAPVNPAASVMPRFLRSSREPSE